MSDAKNTEEQSPCPDMTLPTHAIIIAAIILLCCTAGCISAPPGLSPDKDSPATEYPPLSIEATPVRYAEVNGVRLAYREFGGGERFIPTHVGNSHTVSFRKECYGED